MGKQPTVPLLERLGRRHPRALIAVNVALLVFITEFLLTTTEAPVVLYQAF